MSEDYNFAPPTLAQRLEVFLRFGAVILAGAPTTTLIPLPLTQALTKRYQREELLKRLHFMVPWARFSARRICGIDVEIRGRENLPCPSRGHLYVSNHQSYLDILILMDALDTVAFLSKELVKRFPVLGRSAYCGGTVFMMRSDKGDRERALRETLRMCHQSTAVVVFPEGTRTDDGELRQKIYPRAIEEAWRRGLSVVPVGLDGSGLVFPKAMDRVHCGRKVVVSIGETLDPADSPDAEAFVDACWGRVGELFEASRSARRAGA
jgi:1-acyl-sn-glycerol-3-phosphate acyltransferase